VKPKKPVKEPLISANAAANIHRTKTPNVEQESSLLHNKQGKPHKNKPQQQKQ